MPDLRIFKAGAQRQETLSVAGRKARVDDCVSGQARFMQGLERCRAGIEISERATKGMTVEKAEADETMLYHDDHNGAAFYGHQRFCALVRSGNRNPEISLEDGLWTVLIGEACEESATRWNLNPCRDRHSGRSSI